MELPPFEILAAAFDDDDNGILDIPSPDDPFAPIPLDFSLGQNSSILNSSIASLLTSSKKSTIVSPQKVIPSFYVPSLSTKHEDEMSDYVEALSKAGSTTSPSKPGVIKKSRKLMYKHHSRKSSVKIPNVAPPSSATTITLDLPRTAYELFCQHVRTQLLTCDVAFEEWDEIIGRRWKLIDEPTKSYFEELAQHERVTYKNAIAQYKKQQQQQQQLQEVQSTVGNNGPTTTTFENNKQKHHHHRKTHLPCNITPMNSTPTAICLPEPTPIFHNGTKEDPIIITPHSSSNDLVYNKNKKNATIQVPVTTTNSSTFTQDLAYKLGSDNTQAFIQMFATC